MGEVSCKNCAAACCKGPTLMSLTAAERDELRAVGTILQRVADPVDYDREDVIYPVGFEVHPERQTMQWIVERGREFEALAAGFGRYMLLGTCGNLVQSDDGWQHCGAYDTRPQICRNFEESGTKCQIMRLRAGVDG